MKKNTKYYIASGVAAAAIIYLLLRNCKKKACNCPSSGSGGGGGGKTQPKPSILPIAPVVTKPTDKVAVDTKPVDPPKLTVQDIPITLPATYAARINGVEYKYYDRGMGSYWRSGNDGYIAVDYAEYLNSWKNYSL